MEIRKVLIVDDDAAIRRIAQLSLSQVGKWQVVLAESGAVALQLAASENPDLVMLDVMMPNMDGPTTFRQLREQGSVMPVIFVTAKVMKQEIDSYCQLGASGVITKPFDPMTLPAELRKMTANIVLFRAPEAVPC